MAELGSNPGLSDLKSVFFPPTMYVIRGDMDIREHFGTPCSGKPLEKQSPRLDGPGDGTQ